MKNELEVLKLNILEEIGDPTCEHQCTSNCRRNGCNCGCGEYHLTPVEKLLSVKAMVEK